MKGEKSKMSKKTSWPSAIASYVVKFPAGYPVRPPAVKYFATRVYYSNVDVEGRIGVNFLRTKAGLAYWHRKKRCLPTRRSAGTRSSEVVTARSTKGLAGMRCTQADCDVTFVLSAPINFLGLENWEVIFYELLVCFKSKLLKVTSLIKNFLR